MVECALECPPNEMNCVLGCQNKGTNQEDKNKFMDLGTCLMFSGYFSCDADDEECREETRQECAELVFQCSGNCGDGWCDDWSYEEEYCPGDCGGCFPSCGDRECGSDGCGGDCGWCDDDQECNQNGFCKEPGCDCMCIVACNMENCAKDDIFCLMECVAEGSEEGQQDYSNMTSCLQDAGYFDCDPDDTDCIHQAIEFCEYDYFQCIVSTCGDGYCHHGGGEMSQSCPEDCGGCEPQCEGKNCGPDDCGGQCGFCPEGEQCHPNGQCGPDCQVFEEAECGSFFVAETEWGENSMEWYSCAAEHAWGPELVYAFKAEENSMVWVSVGPTPKNPEFPAYVFILKDMCGPGNCVAASNDGTEFTALAGDIYYIVVDGEDGQSGEFVLEISCDEWECEPACTTPDGMVKECGNDGCNGSCGVCPPDMACSPEGFCVDWGECDCQCLSDCLADCPPEDEECIDSCSDQANPEALQTYGSLSMCLQENGISDCAGDDYVCHQEVYGACSDWFYECFNECGNNQCEPEKWEGCGVCPEDCGCPGDQECYFEHCVAEDMVPVPGGAFWMGCNPALDGWCKDDEMPFHMVHLSAFAIDRTEVTVHDYKNCMDMDVCGDPVGGGACNHNYPDRDYHPINCVDREQAREYCEWRGRELCTEAQWEKAARGTDGRIYPWGDNSADCGLAVMFDEVPGCGWNSTLKVQSVGAGISPYGAYDMAGNVQEWVADYFRPDYYASYEPDDGWIDPAGPPYLPGMNAVLRGGDWSDKTEDLRASRREAMPAHVTDNRVGIRCCAPIISGGNE